MLNAMNLVFLIERKLATGLALPGPREAIREGLAIVGQLSEAELRQVLMHVAVYGGVPAANHAFALAKRLGWGEPPEGSA